MQTMSAPFTLLVPLWFLGVWHHSLAYLPPDDDIGSILRQPQITNYSAYIRKRESPALDFAWKTTSKPRFVTGKMPQVEPILTIYSPGVIYRHGRSRELVLRQQQEQEQQQQEQQQQQQQQQQPDGLKRVIYYATLPEISQYIPPARNHRYTTATFDSHSYHPSVPFMQQRSYDPSKVGRDFVTRVQSAVIDVRPQGDKKKDYHPSFTIIDANPTYPDSYDHRGEMLDGKDKYGALQGYGDNSLMEHVLPLQTHRPLATPYIMAPNLYMRPYHSAEIQKPVAVPGISPTSDVAAAPLVNNIPSPYTTYTASNLQNQLTYKLPTNRYPISSPLAAIFRSPQRPVADIPEQPHRFQPTTGLGDPSLSSNWQPTSTLELSNNLGSNDNFQSSSFDHLAPVNNPSLRRLSYKNEFATHLDPYNTGSSFGPKYNDFGTSNTDFFITNPNRQISFKPHFLRVSDWLTNKPSLDISQFELEDFNNALASDATSTRQDSSSSMSTSPAGGSNNLNEGVDLFSNMNNTIIVPYLASIQHTSNSKSQDE